MCSMVGDVTSTIQAMVPFPHLYGYKMHHLD